LTVQGNTTLGTNSSNTLTVNAQSTFNQAPRMSGAGITSNTIKPDSLTNDLWVNMPQFSDVKVLGTLLGNGNATLGTSASNTLTVNSTATFNQPPTMSGANIASNSIPASAINGGVGGSSSLSSTDLASTPASTKVGYTLTYNVTKTNLGGGLGVQQFTLSPANSVWLINCAGYPTNNVTDIYEVCQSVQPATNVANWLFANPVPNGCSAYWFNTPGSANNLQSCSNGLGLATPLTFTYIVPPYNASYPGSSISGSTTSQSLIYGWTAASVSGAKLNVNFTIQATRIA
jgi:hypothetical protein